MSFFKDSNCYMKDYNLSLWDKIKAFNWAYFICVSVLVSIGVLMLYSVAGASWEPWAIKHLARYGVTSGILMCIALINLRFWMRYAYVLYGLVLILLIAVEVMGTVGMGAQRWLNLGFFQLQPSEMMKITIILALARYFHGCSLEEIRSFPFLIPPALLIGVPVVLILLQPDLGTAIMVALSGITLCFIAGVQIWKFVVAGVLGAASIPIVYHFLHSYQQQRILTFLNPERDPLGAGYHIIQSKIAVGSGGFFGKGFLSGSQSQLSFLPENQTDFIFTALGEEFGLVGTIIVIALFMALITYGFIVALKAHSFFGKFVAIGITTNLALYVFINVGMVLGLLPVVGVPLPFISYGGTALLTLFIGIGLIECVHINNDMIIGRRGSIDDK